MKRLFLVAAFVAALFVQTSFAQDNSPLLQSYYAIKDALVAGNSNLASKGAEGLVVALNKTDAKTLGKAEKDGLLKVTGQIASSKDIKVQRETFADLSDKIIALSKKAKLSADPVYVQYCPMKKSSWLSIEEAIKNPYYGSSMLSCGKVTEVLK